MGKSLYLVASAIALSMAGPATGQFQNTETPADPVELTQPAEAVVEEIREEPASVTLPAETIVKITPSEEITSKKMKEGTTRRFQMAEDVLQNGTVVIPRGSPVVGEIVWRTGKGIGGKSAKFEVEFRTVLVNGQEYRLHGKHRQEGRGNTAAALLGSMIITGRSATMSPGQIVNAFTAEPIAVVR